MTDVIIFPLSMLSEVAVAFLVPRSLGRLALITFLRGIGVALWEDTFDFRPV